MSGHKDRRKDKKVADSGEPVLSGSLYRESLVVPGIVKKRQGVVFRNKFGTYSKSSGAKEGKKHKRLEKVWVFGPSHRVSSIKQRKLNVLENEKKHPLLSLASGHHVERELYSFTLRSESRRGKEARVVEDKVDLAFVDLDEATRWREAIEAQVMAAQQRARSTAGTASQDGGRSHDEGDVYAVSGVAAASPESGKMSVDASDNASDDASGDATPEAADPSTPAGASVSDEFEMQLSERALSLEALQKELRLGTRSSAGGSLEDWRIICSDNGITVLRGTGQSNANSVMLSYCVRAPPRLCVKTLLKGEHQSIQVDSLNFKVKVVESVDAFNDVLHTTWHPQGWLSRLLIAPREIAVRRLWRREDDGSYVVLFKALDHQPGEDAEHPWWNWFKPVPCKMVDTGYTFSPLMPEYASNGESGETLVTHVACLGDMGGWLSHGHPVKRLLNLLYGSSTHLSSFLRPLINHNVALRNKAESERFSVRPYLQSHAEEGPSSDHLSAETKDSLSTAADCPSGCTARTEPDADISPPVSVFKSTTGAEEPSSSSGVSSTSDTAPHQHTNGNGIHNPSHRHSQHRPGKRSPPPWEVATCDPKYWSCPGSNGLKVRGKNYLRDKKKIPAVEPVFTLAATDLLQLDQPTLHIARFLPSLRHSRACFTFIVQIMFGSPSLSLTFSWAAPLEEYEQSLFGSLSSLPLSSPSGSIADEDMGFDERDLLDRPFELTLARFLAGGDDAEATTRRNGTVKLIPRISHGPWFVKQAVGTTPCLLGRKLTTRYFRGPQYFEMDVDVSSSSVAASVVGLVQGMTKSLVVDMAIVLEGHAPEELPESLLGTVRCAHLDLGSAKYLDTTTGEISDKPPPKGGKRPSLVSRDNSLQGSTNRADRADLRQINTTNIVQDNAQRAEVFPTKSV